MGLTEYTTEQVLMIIKTYPTPSESYGEIVCTAGIRLRDKAWIRIFPYPFRLIDGELRFKKWEIIEAPLQKAPNDPRPESYKLFDPGLIKSVRDIETGGRRWSERMSHLRSTDFPSVAALLDNIPPKGDQNWGPTLRPVKVRPGARFYAKPKPREWNAEEKAKLAKAELIAGGGLFGEDGRVKYRQLEKVPYEFRLVFQDATGSEYDYMILDWEIAMLYFKMRAKYGETDALEKVRAKIEDEIFAKNNETYLVLGTLHHSKKQKFLGILGFIYPLRPPPSLFDFEG